MEVSKVIGVPPVIIHFKRIFPYKPSTTWGTPMAMESPRSSMIICTTSPKRHIESHQNPMNIQLGGPPDEWRDGIEESRNSVVGRPRVTRRGRRMDGLFVWHIYNVNAFNYMQIHLIYIYIFDYNCMYIEYYTRFWYVMMPGDVFFEQ